MLSAAQVEMVLREHNPVNVLHDRASFGASAIQCLCDWTWRAPMQHAHHVGEALRIEPTSVDVEVGRHGSGEPAESQQ